VSRRALTSASLGFGQRQGSPVRASTRPGAGPVRGSCNTLLKSVPAGQAAGDREASRTEWIFSRLILPGALKARTRRPVHFFEPALGRLRGPALRPSGRFRCFAMRMVCAVPRDREVRRDSREPSLRTKASNCARTSRGGVRLPDRIAVRRRLAGTPPDSSDMPFHDASGRKDHPIENVNRVHQPSLDRFAYTLDCDTTSPVPHEEETPDGTVVPG